ncbi:hypothetical protein ABL623_004702, partial [Salmonella enterica subsp. enterica serovar Newport]|nr:hypothetical protein [Salmonella enterica subsp. enterica serovar Newport]
GGVNVNGSVNGSTVSGSASNGQGVTVTGNGSVAGGSVNSNDFTGNGTGSTGSTGGISLPEGLAGESELQRSSVQPVRLIGTQSDISTGMNLTICNEEGCSAADGDDLNGKKGKKLPGRK